MISFKEYLTEASVKLRLFQAVKDFYALEELSHAISTRRGGGNEFVKSIAKLYRDVAVYKSAFDKKLARTLFDYLAMTAIGEAHHTDQIYDGSFQDAMGYNGDYGKTAKHREIRRKYLKIDDNPYHIKRNSPKISKYNPFTALPVIQSLFSDFEWDDLFGGDAWAKIAKAASLYKKLPPSPFVDHVVDLAHNGGIAFNKGLIVAVPNERDFLQLLNRKAGKEDTRSILKYGYTFTTPIVQFIARAKALGAIPKDIEVPHAEGSIEFPVPVQWGNEDIRPTEEYVKKYEMKFGDDGRTTDKEEEQEEESSERRRKKYSRVLDFKVGDFVKILKGKNKGEKGKVVKIEDPDHQEFLVALYNPSVKKFGTTKYVYYPREMELAK